MEITKPELIENTTKYFIRHSLKEVHEFKDKYISMFVNILLFVIFVILIGGILFYKYKGKLTLQEKKDKEKKEKMYIFQKLHQYAYDKQRDNQRLITNLPVI